MMLVNPTLCVRPKPDDVGDEADDCDGNPGPDPHNCAG
jgi:hypothetical protein